MPSFDVVSKVDMAEIDNAVAQANKELSQRYDFKGSDTVVKKEEKGLLINSADEYKVKAAWDVLQSKMVRRHVPLKALKAEKIEPASGGRAKQQIGLLQGIDQDRGREIVKKIKNLKLKVQASIQQDQLRVSGKKRDDLQEVMQFLREEDFSLPLQFENFRD